MSEVGNFLCNCMHSCDFTLYKKKIMLINWSSVSKPYDKKEKRHNFFTRKKEHIRSKRSQRLSSKNCKNCMTNIA